MGLCVFFVSVELTDQVVIRTLRTRLQHVAYDLRLRLSVKMHPQKQPSHVVIVDIDEKSLAQEGHWPWPRNRLAQLTQDIFSKGAAVIAWDLLFPEADDNAADVVAKTLNPSMPHYAIVANYLQQVAPQLAYDDLFSKALSYGDTVLGVLFHNQSGPSSGTLNKIPTGGRIPAPSGQLTIPKMPHFIASIPVLQQGAKTMGFTTTFPDEDGVIRRSPLLLRHQQRLYPALGLEAVRLYWLLDAIKLNTEVMGPYVVPKTISLGHTQIPIDALGCLWIPFRGPMHSFQYYSATDVLHHRIPEKALLGTLVFVGASAFGLGDVHTMPLQNTTYPGVEIHANVAQAMLSGNFLFVPGWSKGFEVGLLLFLGLLGAWVFPMLNVVSILCVTAILISSVLGMTTFLWGYSGWILPEPITTMGLIMALMVLNIAHGFLFEGRKRKQLKTLFGRYVPDTHVDKMLNDKGQFDVQGKTQSMSVLFADIHHFTSLSEHLDAVKVKQLLNDVFTPLTKIIFEYSGTIDKYIGDMVMAFWGAPLKDADHALHSVLAGLSMLKAMQHMRTAWAQSGAPLVRIGIGINTGFMHVGDMGSSYRLAYTVLGDSVNVASRVEALTRYYRVDMIITSSTYQALSGAVLCRHLDRVQVKGKKEVIDIYEPICAIQEARPEDKMWVADHEAGMQAYFQQNWPLAINQFKKLASQPTKSHTYVYQLYLERIARFQHVGLPADWNGSFAMHTKVPEEKYS